MDGTNTSYKATGDADTSYKATGDTTSRATGDIPSYHKLPPVPGHSNTSESDSDVAQPGTLHGSHGSHAVVHSGSMDSKDTSTSTTAPLPDIMLNFAGSHPMDAHDISDYLNPSQLGILRDTDQIMRELQIVSTELAKSISRELQLESKLNVKASIDGSTVRSTQTSSTIAELTRKLETERRKRYNTEELLLKKAHGTSDKSLVVDLTYKNSGLKRDVIRLEEESRSNETRINLLEEENEKLRTELRTTTAQYRKVNNDVVPALQNRVEILTNSKNRHDKLQEQIESLKLENDSLKRQQISQLDESNGLKNQRDSLREALKNLKAQKNLDLRMNSEKIKSQERVVNRLATLNAQLSKKMLAAGLSNESDISVGSIRTNTSFGVEKESN